MDKIEDYTEHIEVIIEKNDLTTLVTLDGGLGDCCLVGVCNKDCKNCKVIPCG